MGFHANLGECSPPLLGASTCTLFISLPRSLSVMEVRAKGIPTAVPKRIATFKPQNPTFPKGFRI